MNFITSAILALCFALISGDAFCQAYIKTDSSTSTGIRIAKASRRKNTVRVDVVERGGSVRYLPAQLTEYGLRNGDQYRSLTLNSAGETKQYFFQRIHGGTLSMYSLPDGFAPHKFFIARNDSTNITPLPNERSEFRKALAQYVQSCEQSVKNSRFVRMRQKSLERFFRNHETCSKSYQPRVHIGVTLGTGLVFVKMQEYYFPLSEAGTSAVSATFAGVFAQLPIGASNFSFTLHPTLYAYQHSNYYATEDASHDLVINELRVSVPLMIRYTFLHLTPSPFVEAGPSYSRHLQGRSTLYTYNVADGGIFTTVDEPVIIPRDQIGFTIGFGFMLRQNKKQPIMIQGTFNQYYVTREVHGGFSTKELALRVGLLF